MAQVKEQRIPFLGLSLLRNQTETLAKQATQAMQQSACHTTYFLEMGDSGNYGKPNWLKTNKAPIPYCFITSTEQWPTLQR